MRHRTMTLLLPFLLVLAAGCGTLTKPIPATAGAPTVDIAKIVEATLAAMTAQAATNQAAVTATVAATLPAAGTGMISGRLSYPADRMPPMYVVAYRAGTQNYVSVTTKLGQGTYTIEHIQPGTYHVIAYTVGRDGFPAGFAGGYTQAVLCGMATECADHSLIDVVVTAGQSVNGINVFDWYAPPGTFPPFPGQKAVPTPSLQANTGGMSGDLMFPASALPGLKIVAFQVGTAFYAYVETAPGQSHYELDNLPAGTYHVVAYALAGGGFSGGTAGGYSQMVLCGLQASCTDHTLVDVVVTSGHITTNVNPNDYYADPGAFPPEPVSR